MYMQWQKHVHERVNRHASSKVEMEIYRGSSGDIPKLLPPIFFASTGTKRRYGARFYSIYSFIAPLLFDLDDRAP